MKARNRKTVAPHHPPTKRAWRRSGVVRLNHSRMGESKALRLCALSLILGLFPGTVVGQSPSQLALSATRAMQNRDYASAQQLYARLAHLEPKVPEIYSNLGLAFYCQNKFESAEDNFLAALRLNAHLFAPNFFLGKIYFEKGRNAAALDLLERAVEARPQDKDARLLLAAVLVGMKQDRQAIAQYQEVLSERPRDLETLYDLGLVYLDLGKQAFERLRLFRDTGFPAFVLAELDAERPGFENVAIAEYRNAISLSPKVPGFRSSLGYLLLKTGQRQKAEDAFRAELVRDPFSYRAFFGLAEAELLKGKVRSAADYLDKAVSIRPEFFNPLPELPRPASKAQGQPGSQNLVSSADRGSFGSALVLSKLSAAQGETELESGWEARANQLRDKLVEKYKLRLKADLGTLRNETQRRELGLRYVHESRYEAGLRTLSPLMDEAASQPQLGSAMAQALFEVQEFEAAAKLLSEIKLHTPQTFYLLGFSYQNLALRTMQKIREINPQSARLHLLVGNSYVARQWYPEAVREYKAGLGSQPNNPELYFAVGNTYLEQFQFRQAEQAYARAAELDPFNANAFLMRGMALVELHQPEVAIPLLRRAIELNSELLEAQVQMGKALAQAGELQAAVRHLELASSTDKDGSLHYQLYNLYRRLNEPEKARQALHESAKIRAHHQPSLSLISKPAAK